MSAGKKIEIEIPVNINQPFFNLFQAWVIKGCCCAWGSFQRYPYIQPKGGHFDDTIGGRGVFTNKTIKEWMILADKDMERYNRKYQTGAKARNSNVRKKKRPKASV